MRNQIAELKVELHKERESLLVLLQKIKRPMTLEDRDLIIQEMRKQFNLAEKKIEEILEMIEQHDASQL